LLQSRVMRFLAYVLLIGCSSSGGTPDSGSNQLPGGPFQVADQVSATITMGDPGDTTSDARVRLSSTTGLCADLSASPPIDHKQQRIITIVLRDVAGSTKTAPTAPGTYTIYPNTGSEPAKSAVLTIASFNDSCQSNDAESGQGQSGTVTLTSIAGGVFAGSYDVVLNTGSHIAGGFRPTACPQGAAAFMNDADHACQ